MGLLFKGIVHKQEDTLKGLFQPKWKIWHCLLTTNMALFLLWDTKVGIWRIFITEWFWSPFTFNVQKQAMEVNGKTKLFGYQYWFSIKRSHTGLEQHEWEYTVKIFIHRWTITLRHLLMVKSWVAVHTGHVLALKAAKRSAEEWTTKVSKATFLKDELDVTCHEVGNSHTCPLSACCH